MQLVESKGRKILNQANITRELGNFLESLKLTDQAIDLFRNAGDLLSLAETQAARSLVFKLMFRQTGQKSDWILAVNNAKAGVDIARESGIKEALAIPLFNYAQMLEEGGKLEESLPIYREAVELITNNPPSTHNRPAVAADIKGHLYAAEYKAGDKTAVDRAEKAIQEIEAAEEDSYNKNVWLSGGHMRIAEILLENDPKKANYHLQKAKEIIDSDPRLSLRLSQWKKLAKNLINN